MKKIFPFACILLTACQPAEIATPTSIAAAETSPTSTAVEPANTEMVSPAPVEIITPENIRISPQDGMTQLSIPAGTFTMGGMDVYRENDEQPAHQVSIDAFWIDQVEVTNGMYNLCVQADACQPPKETRSDNRDNYFGNPEFQDYPVVFVTWDDADTYCQWAERRLPTEAEWEYAARGDDLRNYPWGDELPNEYNANFMNLIGDTSRVGSYAEGASPFGALDMAGNVWEWVADRYRPNYYSNSPAANPQGPTEEEAQNVMRVIRGGSFQEDGLFLRLANRSFLEGPNHKADAKTAEYHGRSSARIGFRCAESGK